MQALHRAGSLPCLTNDCLLDLPHRGCIKKRQAIAYTWGLSFLPVVFDQTLINVPMLGFFLYNTIPCLC